MTNPVALQGAKTPTQTPKPPAQGRNYEPTLLGLPDEILENILFLADNVKTAAA